MNYTFGSLKGFVQTAKAFFSRYEDEGADKLLNDWKPEGHFPLVQIANGTPAKPTPVVVTTSVESKFTGVVGD